MLLIVLRIWRVPLRELICGVLGRGRRGGGGMCFLRFGIGVEMLGSA